MTIDFFLSLRPMWRTGWGSPRLDYLLNELLSCDRPSASNLLTF